MTSAGVRPTFEGVKTFERFQKLAVLCSSGRRRAEPAREEHVVLLEQRLHLRDVATMLAQRFHVVERLEHACGQHAAEEVATEVGRAADEVLVVDREELGFGDDDLDVHAVHHRPCTCVLDDRAEGLENSDGLFHRAPLVFRPGRSSSQ